MCQRFKNSKTTREFAQKMEYFIEVCYQPFHPCQWYNFIYDHEGVLPESRCSFLHGSLLALSTTTNLMPEVIQVTQNPWGLYIIRLRENSVNINWLPTVISVSRYYERNWTEEERRDITNKFSTRSGLYGQTTFLRTYKHYGVTHTRAEIVDTAFIRDTAKDLLQLDWILDELSSIWPVDVKTPVKSVTDST